MEVLLLEQIFPDVFATNVPQWGLLSGTADHRLGDLKSKGVEVGQVGCLSLAYNGWITFRHMSSMRTRVTVNPPFGHEFLRFIFQKRPLISDISLTAASVALNSALSAGCQTRHRDVSQPRPGPAFF